MQELDGRRDPRWARFAIHSRADITKGSELLWDYYVCEYLETMKKDDENRNDEADHFNFVCQWVQTKPGAEVAKARVTNARGKNTRAYKNNFDELCEKFGSCGYNYLMSWADSASSNRAPKTMLCQWWNSVQVWVELLSVQQEEVGWVQREEGQEGSEWNKEIDDGSEILVS